jgi:hypothetical protein
MQYSVTPSWKIVQRLKFQLDERECHGATSALCAPLPPPGEKATARQDKAGKASTNDGTGNVDQNRCEVAK